MDGKGLGVRVWFRAGSSGNLW